MGGYVVSSTCFVKIKMCLIVGCFLDVSSYLTENIASLHYKDESHTHPDFQENQKVSTPFTKKKKN